MIMMLMLTAILGKTKKQPVFRRVPPNKPLNKTKPNFINSNDDDDNSTVIHND